NLDYEYVNDKNELLTEGSNENNGYRNYLEYNKSLTFSNHFSVITENYNGYGVFQTAINTSKEQYREHLNDSDYIESVWCNFYNHSKWSGVENYTILDGTPTENRDEDYGDLCGIVNTYESRDMDSLYIEGDYHKNYTINQIEDEYYFGFDGVENGATSYESRYFEGNDFSGSGCWAKIYQEQKTDNGGYSKSNYIKEYDGSSNLAFMKNEILSNWTTPKGKLIVSTALLETASKKFEFRILDSNGLLGIHFANKYDSWRREGDIVISELGSFDINYWYSIKIYLNLDTTNYSVIFNGNKYIIEPNHWRVGIYKLATGYSAISNQYSLLNNIKNVSQIECRTGMGLSGYYVYYDYIDVFFRYNESTLDVEYYRLESYIQSHTLKFFPIRYEGTKNYYLVIRFILYANWEQDKHTFEIYNFESNIYEQLNYTFSTFNMIEIKIKDYEKYLNENNQTKLYIKGYYIDDSIGFYLDYIGFFYEYYTNYSKYNEIGIAFNNPSLCNVYYDWFYSIRLFSNRIEIYFSNYTEGNYYDTFLGVFYLRHTFLDIQIHIRHGYIENEQINKTRFLFYISNGSKSYSLEHTSENVDISVEQNCLFYIRQDNIDNKNKFLGFRMLKGYFKSSFNTFMVLPLFISTLELDPYKPPYNPTEPEPPNEPTPPTSHYWKYQSFRIVESNKIEISFDRNVDFYNDTTKAELKYNFTNIKGEPYTAKFYYNPNTINTIKASSLGDWGINNWVRDLLVSIANVFIFIINNILLFFQFLLYCFVVAFNYLIMFIVMMIIVPFFWNVIVYWIIYGLVYMFFNIYIGLIYVLGLLIFALFWLYQNVIVPATEFFLYTALPLIIDILIIVLAHIITLLIYLVALGQIDYGKTYDSVYELLSQIGDFFLDSVYLFIEYFPDFLLYIIYYLILIGMLYTKLFYSKAKGFPNRTNELEQSIEVYIYPITFSIEAIKEIKEVVGRWT
ncbi:MAG: hypothetical protein ACTSQS_11520, partial [Promethearchaeota archaeon]